MFYSLGSRPGDRTAREIRRRGANGYLARADVATARPGAAPSGAGGGFAVLAVDRPRRPGDPGATPEGGALLYDLIWRAHSGAALPDDAALAGLRARFGAELPASADPGLGLPSAEAFEERQGRSGPRAGAALAHRLGVRRQP